MEPESKPTPELKPELVSEWKLPSAVLGLDLTADGGTCFVACQNGEVYKINAQSGERAQLGRHTRYASSVHRVEGKPWLISGGYDGCLLWHDFESGKVVRRVQAHAFWSWRSTVSKDGRYVASVTGQYLCGGFKYEPAAEREPSVRVHSAKTGELLHSFSHVPPVQSVAISQDNRYLAAGNLMGEIRVWDLENGQHIGTCNTDRFTGWGIIKGHYYTGGIFALAFAPSHDQLLAAGMGSTTDPAAGNGLQLWQRFQWQESKKVSEAREDEIGRGLMETLVFHPEGKFFVMAGRLFNGKWNTAFFDDTSGALRHSMDTKMRSTAAAFDKAGTRLFLAGTTDQGKKKDDQYPECGRVKIYKV